MYKTAILIFAFVAVVSARIRVCDRGVLGPHPQSIRITHCPDNDSLCRIVRGSDIIADIDFIAISEASSLIPEVTAYAFGVRAVYELPPDRLLGCNWLTGTFCPVSRDEFATFTIDMPVLEEYPLTNLDIEIRLYDQNNDIHFCFIVEAEVVVS